MLNDENMIRMDRNPSMHHKSNIRKHPNHFMKENMKNQYQGHWTLALAAANVRRAILSVQCTDKAFRLRIRSNQNESKQKPFHKQE